MSFGLETFSAVRPVSVELFTDRYRVAGTIATRFNRVAEILNQLTATHLPVDDATVAEHGSEEPRRPGSCIVAVDEILVMLAPDLADTPGGDMRVPKQPVHAQIALPPLWLSGTVYVPVGSRPTDGLLNVGERFVPMTEVSLASAAYPDIDRTGAVAAVRRDRAHVIVFDEAARPGGDAPET